MGPCPLLPSLPPTFRPQTFVCTHLVEERNDIRTIQELLGHKHVNTTMIYTPVLNRGGRGVHSLADRLGLEIESPVATPGLADHTCSVCDPLNGQDCLAMYRQSS